MCQATCIDHGQKTPKYGRTTLHGKKRYLHRVIYCRTHGLSIDDINGVVVRHTCDNPRCINPEHLLIGTQGDNMNYMHSRERHPALVHKQHYAAIRAEYARYSRESGGPALALKYGLSQPSVSRIVKDNT